TLARGVALLVRVGSAFASFSPPDNHLTGPPRPEPSEPPRSLPDLVGHDRRAGVGNPSPVVRAPGNPGADLERAGLSQESSRFLDDEQSRAVERLLRLHGGRF